MRGFEALGLEKVGRLTITPNYWTAFMAIVPPSGLDGYARLEANQALIAES